MIDVYTYNDLMDENNRSIIKKHSFLYIPDISGFTNFVNNTEIEHSKDIIELLEIIIEANQLHQMKNWYKFFFERIFRINIKKKLNEMFINLKSFSEKIN